MVVIVSKGEWVGAMFGQNVQWIAIPRKHKVKS